MKHSPLRKTQIAVKKLVKRGEITKDQAIQIILQKAIDMLEELKIPEDQSWEKQEYPELFQRSN